MIYISNNLFLTGLAEGINANNPLIGWHSILRPWDIVADEDPENPGRLAVNMWNPDTASVWSGESQASFPAPISVDYEILLNNPNNEVVDYLGIAKHNFGTQGYTYRFQESTDGGNTWGTITGPKIFGNDNAIIEYFEPRTSGLFRILLQKTGNIVIGPIIAHIKLGEIMVLQRRIYVGHRPATLSRKVKRITNGSESGQYLGQEIVRSYYTASLEQRNNTPEYVRQEVKPFIDHVNGHNVVSDTAPSTFFFAWRPGDYPDEVIYAWTRDNIEPENEQSNGLMKWSFDMEGVV